MDDDLRTELLRRVAEDQAVRTMKPLGRADRDRWEAVDALRAQVGLGPLGEYLAQAREDFRDDPAALVPCGGCAEPIAVDAYEPGVPFTVTCPACGATGTFSIDR